MATPFTDKRILFGITGGIAAYKAADLVSKLVKRGHSVRVAMTPAALEFVSPLTFQTLSRNPVMSDTFRHDQWEPGHIAWADVADLLLIAPASANTIAAMANGFASNPVTEIALATLAPVLVAPAMNGKMWLHPATRENVEKLQRRGVHFIGPEEGILACGYEGIGRLWNVEGIVARAEEVLAGEAPRSAE